MNSNRRFFLAVAALIFAFPATSLAAWKNKVALATDPVAIVTAIYEDGISNEARGWMDRGERGKVLTKSLAALWIKAERAVPKGDAGPVDFDLVADTNGMELKSYKLTVDKLDDTTATIAVKLGYSTRDLPGEGDHIVRYDLVRVDGKWKIDNIYSSNWSLREMLAAALKP